MQFHYVHKHRSDHVGRRPYYTVSVFKSYTRIRFDLLRLFGCGASLEPSLSDTSAKNIE